MMQTVKVPLASNALYVSGTVNGVDKVWTMEEGNVWWTTAERSADGVYRVVLSIVYGDGKTAIDSITLYYGLVLVTDRTAEDVTNGTEKGSYNASDLNRVGAAMIYLRDRLNSNGYDVQISPKTDWREIDVPTESTMSVYLNCLGTLKSAITLPYNTPQSPETMKNLDYNKANNIEKILENIDKMLSNSLAFMYYSGEIYSGEVI